MDDAVTEFYGQNCYKIGISWPMYMAFKILVALIDLTLTLSSA